MSPAVDAERLDDEPAVVVSRAPDAPPVSLTWSEYAAELEARGLGVEAHASGAAAGASMTEDARTWLAVAMSRLARGDREFAREILSSFEARRLEGSLYAFLEAAWPEIEPGTAFETGPHIRAICDHVQAQLEDRAVMLGLMPKPDGWTGPRCRDLLIRVPPRCLKTIVTSVCATAWAWLRWPTLKILSLSSNPRVTTDASDLTRKLIRSDWYRRTFSPAWSIREDLDGVSKFGNTAGGWRAARGITSRITGEGADWLLVDDPHDGQEVYSKAKRDAVCNKWRRAVQNRVNDPRTAIRTGIMQALHFQDWGQERIAEGWPTLVIRMRFEARDRDRRSPIGWVDWRTEEGETLHPRFSPEWCENTRASVGPLEWAAQYQQDPAPIDGGLIKAADLCYFDEVPDKLERLVITVDAAFKASASGSRVSVQVVGQRGPDRFVLDNVTKPMHLEATIQAVEAMRVKWPKARVVLVEDKANGSEIIRRLREVFAGVVAVNPGNNSKEARLMSVHAYFVGRNVWLPRHASWTEDMVFELTTFPAAPHDDQVDALAQALIWMRQSVAARNLLAAFGSKSSPATAGA